MRDELSFFSPGTGAVVGTIRCIVGDGLWVGVARAHVRHASLDWCGQLWSWWTVNLLIGGWWSRASRPFDGRGTKWAWWSGALHPDHDQVQGTVGHAGQHTSGEWWGGWYPRRYQPEAVVLVGVRAG